MQDEQAAFAGLLQGKHQKLDQPEGQCQAFGSQCVAGELGHDSHSSRKENIPVSQVLKQGKNSGSPGGGIHGSLFEKVISLENLFAAWREFQRGKRFKEDVLEFALAAEEHLIRLHRNLANGRYTHSPYRHFIVSDPKPRDIHKASVRDRVLHHAIHRVIEPMFEKRFIYDTYSSRKGKGTHRAVCRFEQLAWKLCRNRTRTVWVLQCDVRKFFASIDHVLLLAAVTRALKDERLLILLSDIITSFSVTPGKGIPLGNLTSQLFANAYLDPLDQYVKRVLCAPVYLRYADDMLLAHTDKRLLLVWCDRIEQFLSVDRKLVIHPHKTTLRKWHQGIDFLGYVSFPTHRVLRTRTRRRMLRRLAPRNASSYFGMTTHARALLLKIRSMLYSLYEQKHTEI